MLAVFFFFFCKYGIHSDYFDYLICGATIQWWTPRFLACQIYNIFCVAHALLQNLPRQALNRVQPFLTRIWHGLLFGPKTKGG